MRIKLISLFAIFALAAGCAALIPKHADPLAGWQGDYGNVNQLIANDCQDYIQKLSQKQRDNIAYAEYFKDSAGQHAVEITITLNGTNWRHILIYDKDNKRIKTVKYISGNSRS